MWHHHGNCSDRLGLPRKLDNKTGIPKVGIVLSTYCLWSTRADIRFREFEELITADSNVTAQ